ncbi:hypothetical protein [Enterococcus mundtii]|uniref:hypothetical protein n=1 Tax=Enterococcus mundtii TaxID=53346 RepID=UPI001A972F55|nr:hypothetical protein [Enterococcus mundtii]MBO1087167.1 hypothetical protein [Enterococcus mundtii]
MENAWIEAFEKDVESISRVEDSLDRLLRNAYMGIYDEEFHQRIINDGKALKNRIFGNDNYDRERKWLLTNLINSVFKVAKIQMEDVLEIKLNNHVDNFIL